MKKNETVMSELLKIRNENMETVRKLKETVRGFITEDVVPASVNKNKARCAELCGHEFVRDLGRCSFICRYCQAEFFVGTLSSKYGVTNNYKLPYLNDGEPIVLTPEEEEEYLIEVMHSFKTKLFTLKQLFEFQMNVCHEHDYAHSCGGCEVVEAHCEELCRRFEIHAKRTGCREMSQMQAWGILRSFQKRLQEHSCWSFCNGTIGE